MESTSGPTEVAPPTTSAVTNRVYSGNLEDSSGSDTIIIPKTTTTRTTLPFYISRYVYISHFLSAWGDRMWQFGVGLFLVIVSPDNLRVTAVYGFCMGGAILLFGPLVGDWVDRSQRLTAARTSLVIQNLSVALCAGVVYAVITFDQLKRDPWQTLCFAAIILIAIISILASTATTIAVERDWIVVICGGDKNTLAATSATLKSIDLITNILAPVATGQIMTFASPAVGALFIAGWNVVTVFIEYYLLWKVYSIVPALHDKQYKNLDDEGEEDVDSETSSKNCCGYRLISGVLVVFRGWRTYMKYNVAFAGLGLACLYMTVLGFDNITVGYAYTQGINESIMGVLMAAGAGVGILGTLLYPCVRRRFGLERSGLFGLVSQISILSLCVASIWTPGSPFDPFFMKHNSTDDSPSVPAFDDGHKINISDVVTYQTNNTTAENVTAAVVLQTIFGGGSTASPPDWLTITITEAGSNVTMAPSEEEEHSYISVALLLAGIIGARCGLWMTDLTITQLYLEQIDETERGIVLGVQTSLNQLMDMLKFIMVIVAPQPEVFGILILISFAFVCLGAIFYMKYSRSVRGHLFHFNKLIACGRKTDLKNNNMPENIIVS